MAGNGGKPKVPVDWWVCQHGHEGGSFLTAVIDHVANVPFPHGMENRYCMACILIDAITRLGLQPMKHEIREVSADELTSEGGEQSG